MTTNWKCDPALLEVRECAGPRWALVFGRHGAMADYSTQRECVAARERVVKALRLEDTNG